MITKNEKPDFEFVDDVGIKWQVTSDDKNFYRLYEWMGNDWRYRRQIKNISINGPTELEILKQKCDVKTKQ